MITGSVIEIILRASLCRFCPPPTTISGGNIQFPVGLLEQESEEKLQCMIFEVLQNINLKCEHWKIFCHNNYTILKPPTFFNKFYIRCNKNLRVDAILPHFNVKFPFFDTLFVKTYCFCEPNNDIHYIINK